ncbi:MAG: hypothetical protein ACR2MO_12160 [Acidimicrobiales bacterium]
MVHAGHGGGGRAPSLYGRTTGGTDEPASAGLPDARSSTRRPRVKSEKGRLVTVDCVPGLGVDPASVLDAIAHAGGGARVMVERGPVRPASRWWTRPGW